MLRRRRPSPAFVLAFLALAVSLSGVAVAAIPAKDGDVHACYSKKTGAVELVDTQKDDFDCEKNWSGFTLDTKPTQLASPDGRFRIEATNTGARLVGPAGSIEVGGDDMTVTASKALRISSGDEASLNVTKGLAIDVGKSLSVRAADNITTESTKSTTVKAKDITVSATGKIEMKATGDVTIKGTKVQQNR